MTEPTVGRKEVSISIQTSLFNECKVSLLCKSKDRYEWSMILRGEEFKYFTGLGRAVTKHAVTRPIRPKVQDILFSLWECWRTRYEGPSYPVLMEDRGMDTKDLGVLMNYLEECEIGKRLHKVTTHDERRQLRALYEEEYQ